MFSQKKMYEDCLFDDQLEDFIDPIVIYFFSLGYDIMQRHEGPAIVFNL